MKLCYSSIIVVVHFLLVLFCCLSSDVVVAAAAAATSAVSSDQDTVAEGAGNDESPPPSLTPPPPSPPPLLPPPSKYNSTNEIVSFINFSNKAIELYWIDTFGPIDPSTGKLKEYLAAVAQPYEVTAAQTFSGHVFGYRWGQARFTHTVDETTTLNKSNSMMIDTEVQQHDNTKEQMNEEDYNSITKQIHILGDMKINIDDKRESEQDRIRIYKKLVEDGKLKPKPETITVKCTLAAPTDTDTDTDTNDDEFTIKIKPYWSPLGSARFLELLSKQVGYYDGCALNRVVNNFITQFGISKNYNLRTKYRNDNIDDDISPPLGYKEKIPFQLGYMSYAGSGTNTRTTEVFIVMPNTSEQQLKAFGTNPWETPFGYVDEYELVNIASKFYSGYGDFMNGNGPQPNQIYSKGGYDTYLKDEFPNLSYIRSCIIIDDDDDDSDDDDDNNDNDNDNDNDNNNELSEGEL
jgi:peptidyl-prolyl cis-trans isomerase A (cyclophilin A)